MFGFFLFFSDSLVISFLGGFVDSSGQGSDVSVQLVDVSSQFGVFLAQLVSGGLVFIDPVLVVSSLYFSGFGDFGDQIVTQSDDSVDGGGVGLDGGSTGDLGH